MVVMILMINLPLTNQMRRGGEERRGEEGGSNMTD